MSLEADLIERARHHAGRAEEYIEQEMGSDADFAAAHAALASFYLAEAIMIPYLEPAGCGGCIYCQNGERCPWPAGPPETKP